MKELIDEVVDSITSKVRETVEAAISQARSDERSRIVDTVLGAKPPAAARSERFTASLRKPNKFLAPTITQHRRVNRRGNGKRSYEAFVEHVKGLPVGSVVRSREMSRLPPKVSSFTVYQNMAKLLREGYIETTPTRGSYITVKYSE